MREAVASGNREVQMVRSIAECRRVVAVAAVVLLIGCAHRGSDPFVFGPKAIGRELANPPACFTAPLVDCVANHLDRDPVERLSSPWREDFEPDLAARICRGDDRARRRWLDGARGLGTDDPREGVLRDLLGQCTAAA
jgi:hypothetical protein